jgi:hypothetical protein
MSFRQQYLEAQKHLFEYVKMPSGLDFLLAKELPLTVILKFSALITNDTAIEVGPSADAKADREALIALVDNMDEVIKIIAPAMVKYPRIYIGKAPDPLPDDALHIDDLCEQDKSFIISRLLEQMKDTGDMDSEFFLNRRSKGASSDLQNVRDHAEPVPKEKSQL